MVGSHLRNLANRNVQRDALPGVGDLVLTCSSNLSRNYSVGHAMASNAVPEHKSLGGMDTLGGFESSLLIFIEYGG